MGKTKKTSHQVTFFSYPKLLFCWPIIALGYLMYFVVPSVDEMAEHRAEQALKSGFQQQQNAEDAAEQATDADTRTADSTTMSLGKPDTEGLETAGWIYLIVAALVLITIGVDLERNYAVFWMVFIAGFYFLGLWLHDVQGFTLFGDIYRAFARLDVRYSRELGLALSILLTPPFIVMLIWVRINHKWRITHNEFEHYAWGRADDSLARGAKRVRSTYPDLLELIIAGAGTLVVYSATGKQELRRIRHVPLLPLVRKRINRLLEVTAVTETDAIVEEEMEEVEHEGPGPISEETNTEDNSERL